MDNNVAEAQGIMDDVSPSKDTFGREYFTTGDTYAKFDSPAAGAAQLSRWYAGIVKLLRRMGIDIFTTQQPVVEIGCGFGSLLELYGNRNTTIIGTDLSIYALAGIHRSHATWPLAAADVTSMPFGSGTVGTVFAFEVLEHLAAPQQAIEEMFRVTRIGGFVIATTPNPLGDILPGIDSNSDPTHISVLPPEQWKRRFVAAGFAPPEIVTAYRVPYVWRWSHALSVAIRLPTIGPASVVVARR